MRTTFLSIISAGSVGQPRTGNAGVQWVWSAQLLTVLIEGRKQVLSRWPYIPLWEQKPRSYCPSLVLSASLAGGSRADILKTFKASNAPVWKIRERDAYI